MVESKSIWERKSARLSLGALLLGTSLFLVRIFAPIPKDFGWVISLLDTLAGALVTTFLLAIVVDIATRKEILNDVVEASLGYILPESLRPAMRWVYSQKIVCIKHLQLTELIANPNNNKLIFIKTTLNRSFRNICNAPTFMNVGISIDEWFEDAGESDIIEFGYRTGNKSVDLSKNKKRSESGWKIENEQVEVLTNEIIEIWFTTQEVGRLNDVSNWVLCHATTEPQVRVIIPDTLGLAYEVGFTYADDGGTKVISIGKDNWKLPITLLPRQAVNIRWWEKEKAKSWLSKGT